MPPIDDAARREQTARAVAKRESWLEQLLHALRLSKGRPTPRWKD